MAHTHSSTGLSEINKSAFRKCTAQMPKLCAEDPEALAPSFAFTSVSGCADPLLFSLYLVYYHSTWCFFFLSFLVSCPH